MQRTSFSLGVALLVVSATLAITITLRKPSDDDAVAATERSSQPVARAQPGPGSDRDLASRVRASQKSQERRDLPGHFSVNVPAGHPQEPDLAQRAREVEAEANSQLEKFTERLGLTGQQRGRLFPILARSSEKYDPAMTISGQSAGIPALRGAAGNKEFHEILEPPQRDQLVEDAVADQILWQDIISKLRRRLDDHTPQVPGEESGTALPAPPAPRGRGNLFDAVDPPQ